MIRSSRIILKTDGFGESDPFSGSCSSVFSGLCCCSCCLHIVSSRGTNAPEEQMGDKKKEVEGLPPLAPAQRVVLVSNVTCPDK